jgi:hypothetical protein
MFHETGIYSLTSSVVTYVGPCLSDLGNPGLDPILLHLTTDWMQKKKEILSSLSRQSHRNQARIKCLKRGEDRQRKTKRE